MKICYFGVYDPEFSRNRIFIKGLRENGVEVVECRDNSRGFLKYLRLFLKHWKLRNSYDVLIVGYTGYVAVPLAKLISSKRVVFDALCTLYEGDFLSRKQGGEWSPKIIYIKILDWLAVKCADIVLVDSEMQKEYFDKRFGRSDKYRVIYTGADDNIYYSDKSVSKNQTFTVVFRGRLLPEAGVKYIIDAANLLRNEDIQFLIIGNGYLENEVGSKIHILDLIKLEWISEHLTNEMLRKKMLACHVSLGQFENHERLTRTIPHKCFESLALGLPYITARSNAISEILEDGKSCIFVNSADPADLAEKILMLSRKPGLRTEISDNELRIYRERFTPRVLAQKLIDM